MLRVSLHSFEQQDTDASRFRASKHQQAAENQKNVVNIYE